MPVTTGTFIIRAPTSVASQVSPATPWGGGSGDSLTRPTDEASLLAGINSTLVAGPYLCCGWVSGDGVATGTWSIRLGFSLGAAVIALDGNPAISFDDLPDGIVPTSALLKMSVARYPNVSIPGGEHLYLQQGPLTESADLGQVTTLAAVSKQFAYSFSLGNNTFLNILSDGFGIRCPFSGDGEGQLFFNAQITGAYTLYNFQFEMSNKSQPINPSVSQVTITSDPNDPNHLKLDQLDSTTPITITDANGDTIPAPFIISQTETELVFLVNSFGGPQPQVINVWLTGNGTQFTGSVPLGKLETIYFKNAPGIYTLVEGKKTDTLYDVENGGTVEVQIPDPFAKLGYIGG